MAIDLDEFKKLLRNAPTFVNCYGTQQLVPAEKMAVFISEIERLRAELTTLLKIADASFLPGCQRCARKIESVLNDNHE